VQHFAPLYRALAGCPEIALKVFFGSRIGAEPYFDESFGRRVRWQPDLLEGYSHEFLPGSELVTSAVRSVSNDRLPMRLDAFRPDAVQVYGFYHGLSRCALSWAKARNVRRYVQADSELRQPRPLLTRIRKRLITPTLLRRADGLLTVGDCNEAYYLRYGVPREKLHRVPFPVDERRLRAVDDRRRPLAAALRRQLSIPDGALIVLGVGKLTRRKSFDHAVRSFGALWNGGIERRAYLVIAGAGPEMSSLQSLADELAPEATRFLGFVEVADLPAVYAAADILVHPAAQDAHPLVTAEGLFCGLPMIVSDRVGSVGPSDDVQPGRNGLEYAYGNIGELTQALDRLLTDPELRRQMGQASREIGERRTLRHCAEAFVRAVC
jgi:glycosyltransferase involved in cell wall biosynthesis